MVEVIADHRRHHPGSPIGRRGHDLPPGGVFLIHRHGIGRHPVVDRVGGLLVHASFGQERLMNAVCAAAHLEPAGQDTILRQPPVDAAVHHAPDPRDAILKLGTAAMHQFIGAFHRGDGHTPGFGHGQHVVCRLKRIGDRRAA